MTRKNIQLKLRIPTMTRFPEGLHGRLVESAAANGRSLNSEILARLEGSFSQASTIAAVREAVADEMAKARHLAIEAFPSLDDYETYLERRWANGLYARDD